MSLPFLLTSTRGAFPDGVTVEDAVLMGYAPDGGMFMPLNVPKIPEYTKWRGLTYPQVLAKVARRLLPEDVPVDDIVERAFSKCHFDDGPILPIRSLDKKTHVAELYHGQTWAFKDYAMTFTAQLTEFYLKRRNERILWLVATSGDTGSSAMRSTDGCEHIDLLVLMPDGERIAPLQRVMMTGAKLNNCQVLAFEADSDKLDDVLRPIFGDEEFVKTHSIGSANSVNFARIMAQIALPIYCYLNVTDSDDEHVEFILPTGGAGNLAAGVLAQRMTDMKVTLSISQAETQVVHSMLKTGVLTRSPLKPSLARAIDIAVPYNIERVFFILSNRNAKLIKQLMAEYYSEGTVVLPEELMKEIRTLIVGSIGCTDSDIRNSIAECYKMHNFLLCPHSATAYAYNKKYTTSTRRVLIATASWEKFIDVYKSIEEVGQVEESERLKALQSTKEVQPEEFKLVDKSKWEMRLRNIIEGVTKKRDNKNM